MNYHIAESNEYIVITGAGIEGVKVCKKTMSWPGQSVSRFTMAPVSYSVNLESMSLEKLECK
jgi:flotillin